MDTINHTIITEKSREIRISGDAQNVEIVNKSLQVEIIEKNSSRIAAEVGAEAAATEAEIAAEVAAEAEIAAEAASAAEEVQEQEAVTDAEAGAENVEETAASAETEQAELEEAETVVETAAAAEEEESAPAETAAAAASEQADQPAPENEETAAVTEESAEPENARKDKDKKKMVRVIGVRFRTAGKIYFFAPGEFHVRCGSHVIVETARGVEYGTVVGLPMDVSESRINQPLKAALLSLSRQILLVIPLVLILPLFWGLDGVFLAPVVADGVSTLIAVLLLKHFFDQHDQTVFFKRKK